MPKGGEDVQTTKCKERKSDNWRNTINKKDLSVTLTGGIRTRVFIHHKLDGVFSKVVLVNDMFQAKIRGENMMGRGDGIA